MASRQLQTIRAALAASPGEKKAADAVPANAQRAVVALILRPPSLRPQRSSQTDDSADVFFILRASDPGRRWAGQVAFPGGHQDKEDEGSDQTTASRECVEEVGLAVGDTAKYTHIGTLRERLITRSHRPLVVVCRVYEQIAADATPVVQESEVAACAWAPLSALCTDRFLRALDWDDGSGNVWAGFPAVQLPVSDVTVAKGHSVDAAAAAFTLWGLTLGMTNELLMLTGLRTHMIDHAALKKLSKL
eukprot:TRINITY_DN364_c0_g4_i1.p1 TRINITY_DN364_c0_g4~~TRINITY_DN364_c0_g4_i1.p1  ORF type:complete len:247 (+),score=23.78 TRINITY_DN364_c0_g4_i1:64-804(+)